MTRTTTPRRDFDRHHIWRVTPTALRDATTLLAGAILRDHHSVEDVIGIAHGGTVPARLIAAPLRARVRTVHARHNTSDAAYQHATGQVQVDLDPLTRSLGRKRLSGRVLLIDDICGSGATLRRLLPELAPLIAPGTQVLTAALCLNTGATTLPDYSVWTVSDWVVFPWEPPPADHGTEPLPTPTQAARHA
ncbi:MAG: phosphoribosyltransferase [Sciscionella sp.]